MPPDKRPSRKQPLRGTPEQQLAGFLAKYSPEIAAQADAALAKMRQRLPNATELVYDNYNALAIGFGPTDRTSEVIFSIAVYPRWVSLFFFHATTLRDPLKLLKGSGKLVRHIVLNGPGTIDSPAVASLMEQLMLAADPPFNPSAPRRLIIKSISAKQRPRRPPAK